MTDATGDYLSAEEIEELTGQKDPVEPSTRPEEFPPDEGVPVVTEDEAAEIGTDIGEDGGGVG